MKRRYAVAVVLLAGALAVTGCRGKNAGEPAGRPAATAPEAVKPQPSIAPQVAASKVAVDLSEVDAMLAELDKQLAEADKSPADSD